MLFQNSALGHLTTHQQSIETGEVDAKKAQRQFKTLEEQYEEEGQALQKDRQAALAARLQRIREEVYRFGKEVEGGAPVDKDTKG